MTSLGRWRLVLLLAVVVVLGAIALFQPPIPQDPGYHAFADIRPLGGIPNWQNVLSNVPFAVVGTLGLVSWSRRFKARLGAPERAGWFCLFAGVTLTGFGSAYYHWAPDNASLVWDRLPMSLGFTGLFAAIIGERISHKAYRLLLWPLVGLGVASVLYWYASETRGAGDLRLYAIVQYVPLLLIPLILTSYNPKWTHGRMIFAGLGFYILAKAFELLDREIYGTLEFVSGHALKHLSAAAGCWMLVLMYERRQPLGDFAVLEFDR